MTENILPFVTDTIIKGNPLHSYISGILETNMNKTCPWLYNNYIQTMYSFEKAGNFDFFQKWTIFNDAFTWQYVKKDFFLINNVSMSQFVRSALSRNFYICCFFENSDNQMLIHGFKNNNLFIIKYNGNCNYTAVQINASLLDELNISSLNIMKIDQNVKFVIYPQLIRQSLLDYIYPENIKDRYCRFYVLPKNTLYGIDACLKITDLLNDEQSFGAGNVLCSLQLLYDHKKLMKKRIEFLLHNGYLNDKTLLDKYSKIEQQSFYLLDSYKECADNGSYSQIATLCKTNEDIVKYEKEVLTLTVGNLKVD